MSARSKLPEVALEFFRQKGRKGGKQRAANLTPEQRSEQARKSVQARWANKGTTGTKKKGTK
jgi:hypothetical protein